MTYDAYQTWIAGEPGCECPECGAAVDGPEECPECGYVPYEPDEDQFRDR